MHKFSLLYAVLCLGPLAVQAAPLNDTGITSSGHATDGNAATCDDSHPAGQDCHYGRDAAAAAGTLHKTGGGAAGFDFSKISNNGQPLQADSALGAGENDWACTRDNVTGLFWEVKVDDASHLRHKEHGYTWYNTDSATNGGAAGNVGNTTSCSNTLAGENCNTQNYVTAVNAAGLCGFADWRMPTIRELESIVDFGSKPAIDSHYIPNTPPESVWSGSPYASYTYFAWIVHFNEGHSYGSSRGYSFHIRLVRGGQ